MAKPLRIAVLGAPGTGKTSLTAALQSALLPFEMAVTDDAAWSQHLCRDIMGWGDQATGTRLATPGNHHAASLHSQLFDLTLLTGLDLPSATADDPGLIRADQALRSSLNHTRIAYAVVYGRGRARCENALLAMRFHMRSTENLHQPASQWRWVCEKCSDPDCEHALFSSLLPPIQER